MNNRGTVLIVGAGKGIGESIALKLAEDGHDLIITYLKNEANAKKLASKIKEKLLCKVNIVKLDFKNRNLVEPFDEIEKYIESPLIGLVNNIGVSHDRVSFDKIDEKTFMEIIDVNIFGAYQISKFAVKNMLKNNENNLSASIVNISSQVALYGGNYLSLYASSKAWLNTFTISLAKEIGPNGIRVNAISPGPVNLGATQNDLYHDKINQIPLRRLCIPQDIANLASFLISDKSSFITGQIIPLNGGR